jgi:hypothetical protein
VADILRELCARPALPAGQRRHTGYGGRVRARAQGCTRAAVVLRDVRLLLSSRSSRFCPSLAAPSLSAAKSPRARCTASRIRLRRVYVSLAAGLSAPATCEHAPELRLIHFGMMSPLRRQQISASNTASALKLVSSVQYLRLNTVLSSFTFRPCARASASARAPPNAWYAHG